MKNDVGMRWEMVKLGDIVKMVTGKTPPTSNLDYFDGDYMWVNPSDFGAKYIVVSKRTVTQKAIDEKKCNLLPKDSILLSCIGDIGKIGILKTQGASNQQITGLITHENVLPDYLFYYLLNNKSKLESLANKAVVSILNNERLRELEVSLPPLHIQKRIAEILDAADALKRKDQELLKKYDELAQAIFIDMFGDPVKNEKGWEVIEFGNCIDYIGDIGSNGSNATISKNIEMLDTEDYAIMIRTTNLNANNFEKNLKYVSEKTYNFFSKSKILGGEIIMNKIGSAGDFWIMPFLNRPVSLGLNQLVIRLKNLNTKYLYYYLSTNYGKAMIKASINGAVTKSITKTAVKALPLLYPNIDLQNKFSKIISLIENQKNQSTTINTNHLFNTLIQKAFKGELVAE